MNIYLIAQTGKIIGRNPAATVFGDQATDKDGNTVYIIVYLVDGRKTIIAQYETEKQLKAVLDGIDQAEKDGRNIYLPARSFDPEKGV